MFQNNNADVKSDELHKFADIVQELFYTLFNGNLMPYEEGSQLSGEIHSKATGRKRSKKRTETISEAVATVTKSAMSLGT